MDYHVNWDNLTTAKFSVDVDSDGTIIPSGAEMTAAGTKTLPFPFIYTPRFLTDITDESQSANANKLVAALSVVSESLTGGAELDPLTIGVTMTLTVEED